MAQSAAAGAKFDIDRRQIQRMSAAIALLSLITLVVSFAFLPGVEVTATAFMFAFGFGIVFFIIYVLLPQFYLNETILMVSDAIYIALITYAATLAGEFGILILFLYFVIIVADSLKYPLSEYIIIVLFTLQAAFFYIIVLAPFPGQVRIGILMLFSFSTISTAVFVWHFIYQTLHERSLRFVFEKKARYLKNVNEHLKAVDAMRTNMLRVTSHEFQTPITAIQNALGLLHKENYGKLTDKQMELLDVASSSNTRLATLVRELLNVARVESGKWELRTTNVDFAGIVRQVIKNYQPAFRQKNIELKVKLPEKAVSMNLDAALMEVVVKNLVDNALKYTAQGSVTVSLNSDYKGIVLSVADTGIGIKSEMLPQVFSKFFRTEEAIQQKPDGYGIGLHYSRVIARKHGGDIFVTSKEGKGSVFTLTLPFLLDSDLIKGKKVAPKAEEAVATTSSDPTVESASAVKVQASASEKKPAAKTKP